MGLPRPAGTPSPPCLRVQSCPGLSCPLPAGVDQGGWEARVLWGVGSRDGRGPWSRGAAVWTASGRNCVLGLCVRPVDALESGFKVHIQVGWCRGCNMAYLILVGRLDKERGGRLRVHPAMDLAPVPRDLFLYRPHTEAWRLMF